MISKWLKLVFDFASSGGSQYHGQMELDEIMGRIMTANMCYVALPELLLPLKALTISELGEKCAKRDAA